MSAKLFISSAFGIIYLLGAELYPTEMRTTGLAVGIFMGRMGAITAPYIADLLVRTKLHNIISNGNGSNVGCNFVRSFGIFD